jgi:Mrp family chromosome partitioning ATPase
MNNAVPPPDRRARLVGKTQDLVGCAPRQIASATGALTNPNTPLHEPMSTHLASALSRQEAIRQLSERLAPTAAVIKSCRVAISGCRPGDGVSTVAAALAIDLSQRLFMRTILVDANLQAPGLHSVIAAQARAKMQIMLDGSLQFRATPWPRLTLATCCAQEADGEVDSAIGELEGTLGSFSVVVIDLGVVRLDPRMLPMVRPSDPILLVVRYGQTERRELATTAAALRAADRMVAGVILNAQPARVNV